MALGIYLDPGGDIAAAGGYLVQRLPGAAPDTIASFEARVAQTLNPSELLHAGASVDEILERLVGEGPRDQIEYIAPHFHCPCDMERVIRAALLLGREEIRTIVERNEELEVRCEFCAEVYRLPADELGRRCPDA